LSSCGAAFDCLPGNGGARLALGLPPLRASEFETHSETMITSPHFIASRKRRTGAVASVALAVMFAANIAGAQPILLTNQHMDFRFQYDSAASGTNQLNIVLTYDPGPVLVSNDQVFIVAHTAAKKTIPSNPDYAFLGPAGAPVWILPQTQDPLRPYLGISAEDIPGSVFDGPMRMELVSVEGPGNFFAYSVSGAGNPPNVKMMFTNGVVSPAHTGTETLIGSHEHNNWAFSTNGLYRVTFRGVGSPAGSGTNLFGREVAFAFQLLPLRPWESWVSTNWPAATGPDIAGPPADPDGDHVVNVMEYALGLNPNEPSTAGLPTASLVSTNGQAYGALTFTRVKTATDLVYEPSARSTLNGGAWTVLTNVMAAVDHGETETVTVRDDAPVGAHAARFLQLRVRLNYP
jgi:surface-anchored protein